MSKSATYIHVHVHVYKIIIHMYITSTGHSQYLIPMHHMEYGHNYVALDCGLHSMKSYGHMYTRTVP